MKKQRKNPKPMNIVALRTWSLEAARKALPYFRSMQQSIRDIWLRHRQAETQINRLKQRPGKPDRDTLIALHDVGAERERISKELEEVSTEMVTQSLFCVDPILGTAALPFLYQEDLAWYIVDLFDPEGISVWRRHTDSLETRRPLAELDQPEAKADPDIPTEPEPKEQHGEQHPETPPSVN